MIVEDMMVEMKEIVSDLVNVFCCLVSICFDDKIILNDIV